MFTENFSKNSNLDEPGISLPVFPSRTKLKLHNISVTHEIVKKVIMNLNVKGIFSWLYSSGGSKGTCTWKFIQCHFIASKLNTGCGGYVDKIYKILGDILDLKASFPLVNFFIRSEFFLSKIIKSRIGFYFFLLCKKLLTNHNSAKSCFKRKNSQVENWLNQPS